MKSSIKGFNLQGSFFCTFLNNFIKIDLSLQSCVCVCVCARAHSVCEYLRNNLSVCEYLRNNLSVCEYLRNNLSVCEYLRNNLSVCEYLRNYLSFSLMSKKTIWSYLWFQFNSYVHRSHDDVDVTIPLSILFYAKTVSMLWVELCFNICRN